jgi:hypothetical protein
LITLIAGGTGTYAAGSALYGAFHFLQGDHERGKRHMVLAGIGAGVGLTAAALGTSLAGLPHA